MKRNSLSKSYIPITLILCRLFVGFVIIVLSIINVKHFETIAVCLLIFGLLTDIFDGIIARYLNVSTQKLRRLDSTTDQIFFISVSLAAYIYCPEFFQSRFLELALLLALEALAYLICFIKFRKEIATHSWGAKVWTLLLVATLIQILIQCNSYYLFTIFFWVGIVSRLEIIYILFILKKWTTDVPTFYHAILLRKNRKIKRNKLLNG